MFRKLSKMWNFVLCGSKPNPIDEPKRHPFVGLGLKNVDRETLTKIMKLGIRDYCQINTCGEGAVIITGEFDVVPVFGLLGPECVVAFFQSGGCSKNLDTSEFENRERRKQAVKDYCQDSRDYHQDQADMWAIYNEHYKRYARGARFGVQSYAGYHGHPYGH